MIERQHIASGSPYEGAIGFSRAVRVGDRVLVAGTAPIWPDGSCDPDPKAQAHRALAIIVEALHEAGARTE
ncbi:MAG: RidA family protein, partial [Chloroflexi bacterium]|nr:RidA family protein [Chloroflexota bacterium]